MDGALSPLFHMPSWCAQVQLPLRYVSPVSVFAVWAVLIPNDRNTPTLGQEIEWCHTYFRPLVQTSLCGDFLPWLPVHAQIDEQWSRTRISFIKAVTCDSDLCMQVAMQTDPYINTARCVGIAAPTHLCVITQLPTDLAVASQALLFQEALV
jgi:hypothetical protein